MENRIYLFETSVLEDPEVYSYWYKQVTAQRRSKVDAFRRESDRRLSLAAGALLVHALSQAGVPDREMNSAILSGENGKPYLAGREDLHFNLSHSGELAVCAVSDRPVGVDIEKTRHFSERLARYVFHPDEIRYVKRDDAKREMIREGEIDTAVSSGEESRQSEGPDPCDDGFTELWTIKESLMKYLGTGIRLSPKAIYLHMQDGLYRDSIYEDFLSGDSRNGLPVGSRKGLDQSPDHSFHEPVRALCDEHRVEELCFTGYEIKGYSLTVCSPYKYFTNRVERVKE